MLLLLGFAVLAGAGTALSPCVLPVLPALLSAGGVGGGRRPLGVVIGLTVTFTVTIVGIADVVNGVGLGSDPLRDVTVAVLLASGLALIVPGLADRLEARLSRVAALGVGGHSNRPLTMASLRGRVVLVDFWTYTCINCIRTLPYLKAWDATYRDKGLTIIGVHTPEFAFEHDAGNVESAIARFGLGYPVAQDNNMGTWNAYGNQYWPADYLIDASGHVRYAAAGEGDYSQTETAIRVLLAEAGKNVGPMSHPTDLVTPSEVATPETYLGTARAQGWRSGPRSGVHDYGSSAPVELGSNEFAFTGTWSIAAQPATAVAGAGIDIEFEAKNVYLVLSSQGEAPRKVQVLFDGKPIPSRAAGADVHDGAVTVSSQRLYSLVSLPGDARHRLTLRFAPGVSGYAFTFG